eukprot:m.330461 g.330461  ORF g.330461 m.330461 type:complete len:301 (-) comp20462_c0_seq1:1578-2480(-)
MLCTREYSREQKKQWCCQGPHRTCAVEYCLCSDILGGYCHSRELSDLIAGFASTGLPGLYRIDTKVLDFSHGRVKLFPDWHELLHDAFAEALPHLNEQGCLRGFFVGDELTAQGLPFDDLVKIVDALNALLVSANVAATCRIIYYNESIVVAGWTSDIPHNLTHFSMDYYHGTATGRIGQTVWDLYKSYVLPKLGPNTKMLFVPQAFGSKVDTRVDHTFEAYVQWSMRNLTEFIQWSSLDDRIVGFNPWHLLNRPVANVSACCSAGFGCCEIGASNMPQLFETLVQLGQAIKGRLTTTIS